MYCLAYGKFVTDDWQNNLDGMLVVLQAHAS